MALFGPATELWALPDSHPAAGTSYGLGRVRRVTVKARYRLNGSRSGVGGGGSGRGQPLQKHLVYLARPEAQERAGDERDERAERWREPANDTPVDAAADATAAVFFDAEHEAVDASHLPQAWRCDRHHWRLIVSPEESENLDLKVYGRGFVGRLERHLRTDLEWVGVVHINTDYPHVHLLIRGRRDNGPTQRDLTMTPATVSTTLRELAEAELTNRLGLHDEKRAEARLTAMAADGRATPLDGLLDRIARAADDRGDARRPFRLPESWVPEACGRHHLQRRLETLERLGLASREVRHRTSWGGVEWWTLRPDWQSKLAQVEALTHIEMPAAERQENPKRLPDPSRRKRSLATKKPPADRDEPEL